MTSNFQDSSPNWVQSQNGMSNVKVTSFDLRTSDNTVLASTYGRGIFTGKFFEVPLVVEKNDTEENEFKIYPTLSDGTFYIVSPIAINSGKLEILNSNGMLVYQLEDLNFKANEKIEISVNIASGVYFVKITGKEGINSTTKIIIS